MTLLPANQIAELQEPHDNASGRTIVLEALCLLAKEGFKPKNTIEFHFYAAEEAGL